VAPRSVAEGPCSAGIGSVGDAPTAQGIMKGAHIPLRGRIFLWKKLLCPSAVVPDFTATRVGQGFACGLRCQAPREGD
jgi:hypothetical protein